MQNANFGTVNVYNNIVFQNDIYLGAGGMLFNNSKCKM